MRYRKTLYENYSEHFGGGKSIDYVAQYSIYEDSYRDIEISSDKIYGDLGCGTGAWLSWLESKGARKLVGFDISVGEIIAKSQTIEWRVGDVVTLLENCREEFDILNAKDLFEHFTKNEAVDFLTKCKAALKPGGQLWILTFNAQSPLSSATRYGDFTHEIGVTPSSLAQVLSACGYEKIIVRGHLPIGPGINGKIRKSLFSLISIIGKGYLTLRHGKASATANIDRHSILPDVIAIASKPSGHTDI